MKVNALSFTYSPSVFTRPKLFEHANLTSAPGMLTGIVGRSGIGKSTLLRVIAGSLTPLSGEIELPARSPGRLSVLYQPQEPQLLPWKRVGENVELGVHLLGVEPLEPLGDLLKTLALQDKVFSYPSQLSGGQIERTVLARTLATPADVYLLDEPLTGTDFPLRLSIEKHLKLFARDHHASIVLVTHDVPQVLAVCDQIYVMRSSGMSALLDPFPIPGELLRLDPRSRRMAPLFGTTVELLLDLIDSSHD